MTIRTRRAGADEKGKYDVTIIQGKEKNTFESIRVSSKAEGKSLWASPIFQLGGTSAGFEVNINNVKVTAITDINI
jgi:hypothetical protein